MKQGKATLCVLAAGVLWGCISLFVRHLDAAGLSALDITGVRLLVAAVGMLVIILVIDRRRLIIRLRDIWLFVGTGVVSVTLFNVCYFTCITYSEASIAVVLLYTSPIFVMVLSVLVFKERVTPRKIAAVALTFVGCALVAGLLGGPVRITPLALIAGIASGLFYGMYSIFGRKALERYDAFTVTFYTFVFGACASLILGHPGDTVRIFSSDPTLILWGIGLGVFCTIAPFLLYTVGLKYLETSRAAICATVEPLVGSVLGIAAYGDTVSPQKLLGMALIIVSVVLVSSDPPSDNGQGTE